MSDNFGASLPMAGLLPIVASALPFEKGS